MVSIFHLFLCSINFPSLLIVFNSDFISLLVNLLLNHVCLVHIVLIIVFILQLKRIRSLEIIRYLMLISLFLSEYDSFAKVKHIILFVKVDLCNLGHPLIQREHEVILSKARPLLLVGILTA